MFGVTSWRRQHVRVDAADDVGQTLHAVHEATDSSNHTLYVNARISGRGARGSGRVPSGMLASAARIPPPGVEREGAPGPPPTIAAARAAPESAPPTTDPEPELKSARGGARAGGGARGATRSARAHLARRVSRAALRGELRHERVPRDRLRGGGRLRAPVLCPYVGRQRSCRAGDGGAGRSDGVVVVVVVAGEVDGAGGEVIADLPRPRAAAAAAARGVRVRHLGRERELPLAAADVSGVGCTASSVVARARGRR